MHRVGAAAAETGQAVAINRNAKAIAAATCFTLCVIGPARNARRKPDSVRRAVE
jgi:hypothetical protein